MTGRLPATLVALVSLAGSAAAFVVAGGPPEQLATQTAPSRSVPVTTAALGCPARPADPGRSSLVAVAPGSSSRAAAGSQISIGPVAGSAPDVAVRAGVGTPLKLSPNSGSGPAAAALEVRGSQGAAPGITAAEWSTYDSTSASGLSAGWCRRPATSWWFAGVDTSVGTQTTLALLNPSPSAAVVDVSVFGPHGPVDVPGGRGIAVAPRSQLGIDLARFAPGRSALAIHVQVTSGRVVACVSTTRVSALTPTGADWVPATAPPATGLLIGAGAPDPRSQLLVVANPGERQVLVHVRFVSTTGTFASTSVADLSVPPGGLVSKTVSGAVGSSATGVLLTASRPVVAATVSEESDPARDFSVSAASPRLGAPSVFPVPPVGSVRLALSSAVAADTEVRLTSVDGNGRVLSRERLTVPGRQTAIWRPAGRTAYVVAAVRQGSDLHGSVIFSSLAGVATVPLLSGAWHQTLLGVVPAPVG